VRAHYGMLAVYANYQRGAWFVGGVLSHDDGYSYADRSIRLGAASVYSASGKPDSSATALQLSTGLDFRLAHDWFMQPYANLLAAHSSQQGYDEYGAGDLSLAYSDIRQNRRQGELGWKLGKTLQIGDSIATPYVGFAQTVAWGDRQPDAEVSFLDAPGASFRIQGNRLPRSWLSGQVGVHWALGTSVRLELSYQGVLNSPLRDNRFDAGLSWRF
jgi:outer membrane autotransporter protein